MIVGLPQQEDQKRTKIGENSADQGGVNVVPGSDGNWNENEKNTDTNIMEKSDKWLGSGKEITPTTAEIPEDNTLSKKKNKYSKKDLKWQGIERIYSTWSLSTRMCGQIVIFIKKIWIVKMSKQTFLQSKMSFLKLEYWCNNS